MRRRREAQNYTEKFYYQINFHQKNVLRFSVGLSASALKMPATYLFVTPSCFNIFLAEGNDGSTDNAFL